MTPEIRPIPRFPEYGASADGRIWRLEMPLGACGPFVKDPALYPRALKPFLIGASRVVTLPLNTDAYYRRKRTVASLVAAAWLPVPEAPRVVKFIDGDRDNCAASNLAWGNRSKGARKVKC